MQERKKTENRLVRRAKYEPPQTWCHQMETEGGIMFGSDLVNIGAGSESSNPIERQVTDNFFSGMVNFGGSSTTGQSGGSSASEWGTIGSETSQF